MHPLRAMGPFVPRFDGDLPTWSQLQEYTGMWALHTEIWCRYGMCMDERCGKWFRARVKMYKWHDVWLSPGWNCPKCGHYAAFGRTLNDDEEVTVQGILDDPHAK